MRKRKHRAREDRTDWKRVRAMTESEIMAAARSDPDAQPTTKADWKHAFRPNLPGKESITIRVDRGVVSFFRSRPGRYQTHMNAALREYMDECMRGKRPFPGAVQRVKAARRKAG